MKTLFLSLLLAGSFFSSSFARDLKSAQENDAVEENLMIGLQSENNGLKWSTNYLLGELRSQKAVIELLRILHNDDNESVRILTALSLMKIGDERGIYAVKRAIQFDSSPRVRRMCANFFYNNAELEEK